MSDALNDYRRPDPQPLTAAHLEFDIARELQQLNGEAGWQSGHTAKTLVKYDGLRIVLIALKARSTIPEHHAEGEISIQPVAGHIMVRAQGQSFELRPGGLLALGHGVPHDVEAMEQSAFLLTIARPAEKARSVP